MQLDKIAAVLRPRNNWEAVDLGIVLLRTFRRAVYGPWLFSVLPICLVIAAVTRNHVGWSIFLIWLLRPMFDRVPLFVLSRSLFGAAPTLTETLREVPRLWSHDLFGGLVLHRLHPSRSLYMPISELEGLRGSKRRSRASLLGAKTAGTAGILAALCVTFELAMISACYALFYFMMPAHIGNAVFDSMATWGQWLTLSFYILAIFAIGPMYVACGFTLYINRRTHLEGWDTELALRGMNSRLQGLQERAGRSVLSLLLIAGLGLFALAPVARAQQTAEPDPGASIERVLAHEDFDRTRTETDTSYPWEQSDSESDTSFGGVALLGGLLEILLWSAAAALLAFLIFQAVKHAGLIERRAEKTEATYEAPKQIFGLDLRPETLPPNIPASVWKLWQDGDSVGAMGLLYRAAISRLVEGRSLELSGSDTERECQRRVQKLSRPELSAYFAAITSAWQTCAYSSDVPPSEHIAALCKSWLQHFEGEQS